MQSLRAEGLRLRLLVPSSHLTLGTGKGWVTLTLNPRPGEGVTGFGGGRDGTQAPQPLAPSKGPSQSSGWPWQGPELTGHCPGPHSC